MNNSDQNCKIKNQLEEHGIVLDSKYAFNPVRQFAPKRKQLLTFMYDLDSTQACNRFKWENTPNYFPEFLAEQMAYNRAVLAFFKRGSEFKLLPCVVNGSLNDYGIALKVKPIAYNGETSPNKTPDYNTLNTEELNVITYGDEAAENKCVLFYDRYNGFRGGKGTGIVPTALTQRTVIDEIVNRMCFLNINLVNSQGKNIILCRDPKQVNALEKSLSSVYNSDKSYAIAKTTFDVQVINNEIKYDEQALWEDIMSWNNLRLEKLGIDNNGLFNKKERMLVNEQNVNTQSNEVVTDAYYEARKDFVKRINETFGNDPDFKRDWGKFNIVDLRVEQQKKADENLNDDEVEYDNINV